MKRTTKLFAFLCGTLVGVAASTAALASLGYLAARGGERDSQHSPTLADRSGDEHSPAPSRTESRNPIVTTQYNVATGELANQSRVEPTDPPAAAIVVSPVSKELASSSESVDDAELLASIEERHPRDLRTQAATLYRAYLNRRSERIERERVGGKESQKPDEIETALLDKAIERIEVTRLELLNLRLQLYLSRAKAAGYSHDFEAKLRAYGEVLRLFEEVQYYSKRPLEAEVNWILSGQCQETYIAAAIAYVTSSRTAGDDSDAHYRGKMFFHPAFDAIYRHNPRYAESILVSLGRNEAHTLLWLRGILDRGDELRELNIDADEKPAAHKHLQAVRMILEKHMRRETDRYLDYLRKSPPEFPRGLFEIPPDPPPEDEDRKRERAELIPDK